MGPTKPLLLKFASNQERNAWRTTLERILDRQAADDEGADDEGGEDADNAPVSAELSRANSVSGEI